MLSTHTNTQNNVVELNEFSLPENHSNALRTLIRFSEQLVQLADRETQALVQNDIRSFAMLQDEKEKIAVQYTAASSAFHTRLNEFKSADPGLLQRLEDTQHELGDKLKSNSRIVERIFNSSQHKIQSSLLSVQELSDAKPVQMTTKGEA